MEFWEKTLLDGTKEVGTDEDIKKGKASWTKGRQDLWRVKASLRRRILTLCCLPRNDFHASWGQLDHFTCSFQRGQSIRIGRELICTTIGYPYLRVENKDLESIFTLNDEDGILIPKGTERVKVFVNLDGKVQVRFEAKP